jgi:hypothetical protein
MTLIFRLADMKSMSVTIGTRVSLHRFVVPGFHHHGIPQISFEYRGRGGDYDRTKDDEDSHENPTCPIIAVAEQNEDFSNRDKTDNGYRAVFYGPQPLHGRVREQPVPSGKSQHSECSMERHEKRNGRDICIREKGIVKVDLEGGRVRVPPLDVRFPEQKGKGADADEHDDCLKESCRASAHGG